MDILKTGGIVSPEDKRDWTLASVGASTTYPSSCFIDQEELYVSMQGQIGSCVGCTGEEIVRNMILKKYGTQEELSFRFVYALAKCFDGYQDEGTYASLVANIIRKYGVPLAKYCPNDVTLDHETFVYNRKIENIPSEAFTDALTRRMGANFTEPVSADGIMKAVNYAKQAGGGVMILRSVGNTYWTDKNGNSSWSKEALLPIRVPAKITSGHCEYLYGYDTEPITNRVRIYWLNHWSKDWCDNGRAWEYLDEWLPLIIEIRISVPEVIVVDNFKYNFTKTLRLGDTGPDVVALQHVLKIEKLFPEDQNFTGYFGPITKNGVIAFQEKYASNILSFFGITQGTGLVGNYTLKKLNSLYGVL